MSSAAERDAIAALAEQAWPHFSANEVQWRGKPVTQARLALAIAQLVEHMRERRPDLATMTGLTAYREDDGIHLTIELGTLPLDPATPVADPAQRTMPGPRTSGL